ncbi:hypothetical protein RRG08_018624 [Elysia crispata]|uniref:Uncharacterized protein n=1 Tax=Elysia crispata TaxID=231223 RepID=A0AAE1B9R9_9GAST|nr:hypothetical protein RRG08_018624 [Elysia crispata]
MISDPGWSEGSWQVACRLLDLDLDQCLFSVGFLVSLPLPHPNSFTIEVAVLLSSDTHYQPSADLSLIVSDLISGDIIGGRTSGSRSSPSKNNSFRDKGVSPGDTDNLTAPTRLSGGDYADDLQRLARVGLLSDYCPAQPDSADHQQRAMDGDGGGVVKENGGVPGRTMCPRSQYGHRCAETCSEHCAGADNTCNFVDGSCDQGCDVGYLPPLCYDTCPRGQYCPGWTGQCYHGCVLGFQPPTCHKECSAGTYGPGCGKTCSIHCADSDHICNKTDGSCDQVCKPGYQGRVCSETCRIGLYGPGCNTTCSDQCVGQHNPCHHIGVYGPGCNTTCSDQCVGQHNPCHHIGVYGPGCNTTCSDQCVGQHNPCHHIDGSCYLGCVQDDQSPMCRRKRVNDQFDEGTGHKASSISVTLFAVVAVVIVIPATAVIVGLLVSRLRMTKRLRTRRSFPEECSARVELVQVENPPLESQPGTLVRRGSNQRYEPMELSDLGCSPNDNVFDQYATPLDMERELGEYEMPLNVKQSDLSQLSGQDINEAKKFISANSKRRKSPTGSSNQEIQEKKEVSGIYCNSDRLPIGHKRQDTKETEKTSVTANNSDIPLTMSYSQLDNETERRQRSKE